MELLNQIFVWAAVILALLSALSSAGAALTQRSIDEKKNEQVRMLEPRKLTEDQKRSLIENTKEITSQIGLMSRLMDGESSDYADQISDVLKRGGHKVAPTIRTSLNDLAGVVGLAVTDPSLEEDALKMIDALNASNLIFDANGVVTNKLGGPTEPNTIYIIVGRKK